jgi:SAM-dependent methyltransferase
LDVGVREGEMTRSIYKAAKDKISDMQTLDIYSTSHPTFKHTVYDGKTMPFPESNFCVVSFIDVLHHIEDIVSLLAQARRVTKKYILIKDHRYEKRWELNSLKIQDWFGNVNTGCPLPHNFLKDGEWQKIFDYLNLKVLGLKRSVNFRHPFPFNVIYPSRLHFLCLLVKE